MSPSERFTNPSTKSDSNKTAVLPTANSPGDSADGPKRSGAGRDLRDGASSSKGAAVLKPKKHGSAFRSPDGNATHADNKR